MQESLDIQRESIINAAIKFVLEYGWCEKSLSEASVSLGEDPQYWGMFFANISSAVEFFERLEDARMLRAMRGVVELDGIRNKISKALFERIINISGGLWMLTRLEEFYCRGIHASSAIQNIWSTADTIWIFAGDKATDFNHYTKRTLLSGVYIAVVKRVLRDEESDIQPYIMECLDKAVKLGDVKKYFKLENVPILRMFV